MPKLVSIKKSCVQTKLDDMRKLREEEQTNKDADSYKAPVHQRLGNDTAGGKMRRQRNNNNNRFNHYNNGNRISVQHRLNKNFVNPAIVARDNILANSINTVMESAVRCMSRDNRWTENLFGKMGLLSEQGAAQPEKKYDMQVQREIHTLQVRFLHFFYKLFEGYNSEIYSQNVYHLRNLQ